MRGARTVKSDIGVMWGLLHIGTKRVKLFYSPKKLRLV